MPRALVARWPNVLTIVVALVVIGSRQLGLAVVMHEAAHRTLFKSRALNDWAGNWLGAYPVWTDTAPYRNYHLVHHAKTGTMEDPDLGLVTPFPISPESFSASAVMMLRFVCTTSTPSTARAASM